MPTMEGKNNSESVENEVTKWLQVALANENLENISVDLGGNSEKGDGYVGDIIFLGATGTDKSGEKKSYNLVLKCSKASATLMKAFPVRETFFQEMYMYGTIFPAFRKFQLERGIENPFDSVPKCYGTYHDGYRYVIALENLKKIGYELWTNGTPLSRKRIDLLIKEYSKFHAVSVAMQEQEPEKFQNIIIKLDDIFGKMFESTDFVTPLTQTIEEIAELLKDDLSEHVLKKWLSFKDQIRHICVEMTPDDKDLRVITHLDCWNNNFLHRFADEAKSIPSKVVILDWQMCKYTSPIYDLSYLLFACISEQDIGEVEIILRAYYKILSEYLTQLGCNFMEKYPVEKFLEEWKKYGKFGAMMCLLPVKGGYASQEDLPDITKSADSGNFDSAFVFQINNEKGCRDRFRPLVKYYVEAGLI